MTALEATNLWLMLAVTAFLVFAVGASFGSFLNVIVYRMPRGMPVSGDASHCPHCSQPIPWKDNVPIFGYLRLRGLCQCRERPISPRYPIVEAVVGALFLLLFFVELTTGGANLPGWDSAGPAGVVGVLWSLRWEVLAVYVHHLSFLYILLACALIERDGWGMPRRLVYVGAGIALILSFIIPDVQPMGLPGPRDAREPLMPTDGLIVGAVGIGAGWLVGFLLTRVSRIAAASKGLEPRRSSFRVGLALVGAYLGWQSVVSVATIAALVGLAIPSLRALTGIWVASLIQVLSWRWLAAMSWWPGSTAISTIFGLSVAALIIAWSNSRRRCDHPKRPAFQPACPEGFEDAPAPDSLEAIETLHEPSASEEGIT